MGKEKAETPEVSIEEEPVVTEPTGEEELPEEVSDDSEADGEQQEPTEVEVVLDGDDGSQPDKQHGIRKRINKLNRKLAKAEDEVADAGGELAHEKEKNKLLTLALEQKTPAELPTPPDPMDYEGVQDPKYVQALNDYNQPLIAAEVRKQTAGLTPAQVDTVDPGLERKQTHHYERASELGAKDFEETEDKAIEILGNDIVNQVIGNFNKSELLLYYLGKNPGKAEEIAQLIKTNPVMGVAELGRMEARLSAKPKSTTEPTPDPDEELQGGSPGAAKSNKFQRKLDKAREDAQDGASGRMQAIADIKKEANDAGVTIE